MILVYYVYRDAVIHVTPFHSLFVLRDPYLQGSACFANIYLFTLKQMDPMHNTLLLFGGGGGGILLLTRTSVSLIVLIGRKASFSLLFSKVLHSFSILSERTFTWIGCFYSSSSSSLSLAFV